MCLIFLHVLSQQITSPEDFALLLTEHFLAKYSQVTDVSISVREYPWQRQVVDGRAHNHAFIFCPEVEHTCAVAKKRGGKASLKSRFRQPF